MSDRVKSYFLLADQYLETSKLLLETLIQNNNSNCGLGSTEYEAHENMIKNVLKSDSTLLTPAIFNSYQCMELFLKGILLLNKIEIDDTHEVTEMIEKIKMLYGEKSNIYKKVKAFYKEQMEIIKTFKKTNNITSTKELYESLRYPENNSINLDKRKKYNYYDLKYNGDYGIDNFKLLLKRLNEVKKVILLEYHTKM